MIEQWKPLAHKHFTHISISNTGRLLNTETSAMYTQRVQPKTGLCFCDIGLTTENGKQRITIYIAREVAEAFINKPPDFNDIPYKAVHKKGVSKLSNIVKNIEWVSQSELSIKNMAKASPKVRNRIGKFNSEKWKGHEKKKYVKIADRPDYKPKPKIVSTKSKLNQELEKEKEALKKRIELIDQLLKQKL